jgi:hypothetical protein
MLADARPARAAKDKSAVLMIDARMDSLLMEKKY